MWGGKGECVEGRREKARSIYQPKHRMRIICQESIISKNMATLILQRPLTFTLKALLNPDAKNPPKGAMREAKMERGKEWSWAG